MGLIKKFKDFFNKDKEKDNSDRNNSSNIGEIRNYIKDCFSSLKDLGFDIECINFSVNDVPDFSITMKANDNVDIEVFEQELKDLEHNLNYEDLTIYESRYSTGIDEINLKFVDFNVNDPEIFHDYIHFSKSTFTIYIQNKKK